MAKRKYKKHSMTEIMKGPRDFQQFAEGVCMNSENHLLWLTFVFCAANVLLKAR